MNRILLTLCIVNSAALIVLGGITWMSKEKVVYIESGKFTEGYQGMIDARKAFQKKATTWQANIDSLGGEIQKAIMDHEKESRGMTAKERKLSEELIRMKQTQLAQYQQALKSQAQQEDNKLTSDVLAKMNAYLKEYGEARGYTIILAATEYGNVAYADKRLDITESVLDGLNKQYRGQ